MSVTRGGSPSLLVRVSLRFFRRRQAVASRFRKQILEGISVLQDYVDGNNAEVARLDIAASDGYPHLSPWAQHALRKCDIRTRKILTVETEHFLYDIDKAREAIKRRKVEAGAARSIISRVQRRLWIQLAVCVAGDLNVCRLIEAFL